MTRLELEIWCKIGSRRSHVSLLLHANEIILTSLSLFRALQLSDKYNPLTLDQWSEQEAIVRVTDFIHTRLAFAN